MKIEAGPGAGGALWVCMETPEGTLKLNKVIAVLERAAIGTRMGMMHKGVPQGSPDEGGWQQAFDKLAAALG